MPQDYQRDQSVREVIVQPLSARTEALSLCCAIALIVMLMAVHFYSIKKNSVDNSLEPCQRKDIFLKNQAPLMYRSLSSVSADIIDLYQDSGSWPEIDQLKSEALPPFAEAFLPTGLRGYAWTIHMGEGFIDYFGVNAKASDPENKVKDPLRDSFVLRIIDLECPEHPALPRSTPLEKGTRFYVQVWQYPAEREYPGPDPASKGWKWIVSSSEAS